MKKKITRQETCTAPPPATLPLPRKIDSRKNYLLSKNLLKLKAYMVPGKTSSRKPLEK